MEKHFKKGTFMGKLFNKNTLKISYSCCPKIKSRIAGHNGRLLVDKVDTNLDRCNCHVKAECPMKGEEPCNVGSVIYTAEVSHHSLNEVKNYVGGTNDFKTRSYRHKQSFRDIKLLKDSALSEFVWSLKNKGITPNVKFEVITKAKEYSTVTKKCYLCCKEKLEIMRRLNDPNNLNSRTELMGKCRHRNKFLLSHVKINNVNLPDLNLREDSSLNIEEETQNIPEIIIENQATQDPQTTRKLRNGKIYPWKT